MYMDRILSIVTVCYHYTSGVAYHDPEILVKTSFHRAPSPNPSKLLPQLAKGHLLVVVLVENLGRGQLKVFLRDVHSALAEGVHAGFCADTLELGTRAPIHLLGNLGQVDASRQVHLAAVDAQDIGSGLHARGRELNLAVDSAGSQKGGVENVETVGGHDDFDILGGLEAVELVEQLQHGPLHFRVAAGGALYS